MMSGTRIDNIPMYGQPTVERPEALKRADAEFIAQVKQASEGHGGLEKASLAWWMKGEEYMKEGNLDYAMRRYNQSWLLNPNSFRPYWGFSRVLFQKGQLDESIKYLEKATQLVDDEFQKVALFSDIATAYSIKANNTTNAPAERTKYFLLANQYFEDATKIDPKYPIPWRNWSQSLLFEGRYNEAWQKVNIARSLGAQIPPQFIKILESKMPEPK
jgi:tetratricopeptide (TPR) repeat protein